MGLSDFGRTHLQTLNELVEVLEESRTLNSATIMDCVPAQELRCTSLCIRRIWFESTKGTYCSFHELAVVMVGDSTCSACPLVVYTAKTSRSIYQHLPHSG